MFVTNLDNITNKIHEGEMLFVNDVISVANGADIYLHHVSGANKYLHSNVSMSSVGEWSFASYEGTTYNDNGTELPQVNRKNDSLYIPESKFYENLLADIDVLGDLRANFIFGYGTNPSKASAGSLNRRLESIFSPNTDILIKLTNNSGSTQTITIIFDYYEGE